MGGTFDPIHFGHLLAAEESRTVLELDEVIFIPAGDPAHKRERKTASPEDRYVMTLLTTLGNPKFTPSRIEIDRKEPSHTVDTLREMRHWYAPEKVDFGVPSGKAPGVKLNVKKIWEEYDQDPTSRPDNVIYEISRKQVTDTANWQTGYIKLSKPENDTSNSKKKKN